jgi:hypothetical protein
MAQRFAGGAGRRPSRLGGAGPPRLGAAPPDPPRLRPVCAHVALLRRGPRSTVVGRPRIVNAQGKACPRPYWTRNCRIHGGPGPSPLTRGGGSWTPSLNYRGPGWRPKPPGPATSSCFATSVPNRARAGRSRAPSPAPHSRPGMRFCAPERGPSPRRGWPAAFRFSTRSWPPSESGPARRRQDRPVPRVGRRVAAMARCRRTPQQSDGTRPSSRVGRLRTANHSPPRARRHGHSRPRGERGAPWPEGRKRAPAPGAFSAIKSVRNGALRLLPAPKPSASRRVSLRV